MRKASANVNPPIPSVPAFRKSRRELPSHVRLTLPRMSSITLVRSLHGHGPFASLSAGEGRPQIVCCRVVPFVTDHFAQGSLALATSILSHAKSRRREEENPESDSFVPSLLRVRLFQMILRRSNEGRRRTTRCPSIFLRA